VVFSPPHSPIIRFLSRFLGLLPSLCLICSPQSFDALTASNFTLLLECLSAFSLERECVCMCDRKFVDCGLRDGDWILTLQYVCT
jgi:hypothetical protein